MRPVPVPPSDPRLSDRMRRTGRRDTSCEIGVRKQLHARGLRYRVQFPVPGAARRRMDVAFTRQRLAVFIDGCFWHGCQTHGSWPSANAVWWREKIEGNMSRDRETDQLLSERGWIVVRVWEHEAPDQAANRIEAALHRRR